VVTGVLALHGLDVRAADVAVEGDFAVELFDVEPTRHRWPDWALVADEIDATLRGSFPLEERLAKQALAYAGERRPSSPRPAAVEVTVADDTASVTSTVIEIRAANAIGLLHRITSTLFALDLDVVTARVSTTGHEVVDAFYVRDRTSGGKITDGERRKRIEEAARQTLDGQAGSR
jgi:[protein-PII] uridylyltransferase